MTQPKNRNAGFAVFDNPKQMLTVQQVAKALGVHKDTVYVWIWTKQLRALKINSNLIRIQASDAEAMLTPAVPDTRKMPKLLKEKSNGI